VDGPILRAPTIGYRLAGPQRPGVIQVAMAARPARLPTMTQIVITNRLIAVSMQELRLWP
jgi:hypothetical protein